MRKTRNTRRPPEPATADELRAFPGCGGLSDPEALEALEALELLAVMAIRSFGEKPPKRKKGKPHQLQKIHPETGGPETLVFG